jgi:hypothetical protein
MRGKEIIVKSSVSQQNLRDETEGGIEIARWTISGMP